MAISNTFDTQLGASPLGFAGGGGYGGGYAGWGGGGFGGIAPFGLFGLIGGLGRGGFDGGGDHHHCHGRRDGDDCASKFLEVLATKNDLHSRDLGDIKAAIAERACDVKSAVADVRFDVASKACEVKDHIGSLLDRAKDLNVAEFRGIQREFADVREQATRHLFLLSKEGSDNTQKILDAIDTAEKARLLERINTLERDRDNDRFDRRSRDVEVNVVQNQNQLQAQAQLQFQRDEIEKARWAKLFSDIDQNITNKFSNKTVQFGAGNVATPTNASANTNA